MNTKKDSIDIMFNNVDFSLLHDINIQKLLFIVFIYIILESPEKPKIITNFIKNYPILKWIVFIFISIRRDKYSVYAVILIFIYQLFYIADNINKN